MYTNLWQSRPYNKLASPKLPQIVAKSILKVMVVFQRLHAVHLGDNPGVTTYTSLIPNIVDLNANNLPVFDVGQMNSTVELGRFNNRKHLTGG
jgi:hypothetical protein